MQPLLLLCVMIGRGERAKCATAGGKSGRTLEVTAGDPLVDPVAGQPSHQTVQRAVSPTHRWHHVRTVREGTSSSLKHIYVCDVS